MITTIETNEAIWISPLFGIELKINVSKRSVSALKKFIEVLEYNPDDILSLEDYVILEDLPQDERQGQPIKNSPEASCLAAVPTQKVLSTPQSDAITPTQERETIDGLISNCFKNSENYHKLLDFMAKNGNPIEISKDCARDQGSLGTKTSTSPQNAPERNLSVPKKAGFFIPKFTWDKTKEKSYRTIFFFEHEDGRVMISYMQSRIFTTKAVVLALPYPVPHSYAPLQALDNNKRTAFRFYREYLAKNREQGAKAKIHEGTRAAIEEKDKGIFEDILLHEAENKDEDEIMSDSAKEAEEKRLEKLKKVADVNKSRWKDRVETEMSPRTKELREKFGFRGLEIRDKS